MLAACRYFNLRNKIVRFSQEEMELALKEINKNQQPVAGFIGSLVGAVVVLALYMFFFTDGQRFVRDASASSCRSRAFRTFYRSDLQDKA